MSIPFVRIIMMVALGLVGILVLVRLFGRKKTQTDTVATAEAFPVEEKTPAAEAPRPTTTTPTTGYSSGPAKIFVNGGAPASGNVMGTLYVDGKSLSLRYTDAPIEVSVSSGKHHIVIEGGHYGDARVDRAIDFGTNDVLTVDMPGGDDADVIRHQMIGYVDYSRALRESGFRVTRKSL